MHGYSGICAVGGVMRKRNDESKWNTPRGDIVLLTRRTMVWNEIKECQRLRVSSFAVSRGLQTLIFKHSHPPYHQRRL